MSSEEAIQIITNEELYINNYNWFEDRAVESYEIGICLKDGQWLVYETEYKENDLKSACYYNNKEKALNDFIINMRNYKPITENRLSMIIFNDDMIVQGIRRRLSKWNLCKDRVFSV